ncbi:MAG: hypothetical protein JWO94_2112 [Verrucomicrobiaceae bacterium]|nr:hypothetical protein [Verrucomicrobiaceae bacterium]
MISRSLLLLAAFVAGCLDVSCPSAVAQTEVPVVSTGPTVPVVSGGPTIVYQLVFSPDNNTNTSTSFQPYDSGYYIAPLEGGSGTMILTRPLGGLEQYLVFDAFGQLFVARDGGDKKAVLTCTAASNISTTAFFAIGDASDSLAVDSGDLRGTAFYAPHLSGYALTAQSSTTAGSFITSTGVAGSTKMEALYDDADTNNAIQNNLGIDEVVTLITTRLKSLNYAAAPPFNVQAGTGGSSVGSADTSKGPGDLVVYRMSFSKNGESINYKPFSGGYYVASASNGESAVIIEASPRNSGKVYKTYSNFGSLFVMAAGSNSKAALFATDVNSFSSTTFYAVGDASQSFKVDAPSFKGSVNFAKKLKGYAISADSGFDLAFLGNDEGVGVGGVADLTASYLEDTSKLANKNLRTIATEIKQLEKELEEKGFTADTNEADQ